MRQCSPCKQFDAVLRDSRSRWISTTTASNTSTLPIMLIARRQGKNAPISHCEGGVVLLEKEYLVQLQFAGIEKRSSRVFFDFAAGTYYTVELSSSYCVLCCPLLVNTTHSIAVKARGVYRSAPHRKSQRTFTQRPCHVAYGEYRTVVV